MKISSLSLRKKGFVRTNSSILPFLIAILMGQVGKNIDESDIGDYINNNPIDVGNYIVENISDFVHYFNEGNNETWQASSVENYFEINVFNSEDCFTSMFIDLDLDNGYIVLDRDYSFACFETTGESPFKNINADVYNYYVATSYFTYYIDGVEYNIDGMSEEYIEEHKEELYDLDDDKFREHYDGQVSNLNGSGGIENLDKYINSRYGSGWKEKSSTRIDMNLYSMYILSAHSIDGYTEGNCWAVSAYNCLQGMQKNKYSYCTMPSGNREIHKQTKYYPGYHENWQTNEFFRREKNVRVNKHIDGEDWEFRFPDMWVRMRQILNNKKKYINDGGNTRDIINLVEETSKSYGHCVRGSDTCFWESFAASTGINKLINKVPLVWGTHGDTYGNHAMTVCGYKLYEKEIIKRFWFFGWRESRSYEQILFYEICDGWTKFDGNTLTSPTRFYDMTAHSGYSTIVHFNII